MSSDSQPTASETGPPKLRGLWEVMYTDVLSDHVEEPNETALPPAEQVAQPETAPPAPEPIAAEEQTTEAEAKPHRPHGLWDVMYTDVLSGAAVGLTPEPAAPLQPQPRSLWSVMGAGNDAEAPEAAATKAEVAEQPPVTTVPNPLPTMALYMEPPTPRPVRLSRDDLWLIVLGLLAICLSVLAILPSFWLSLPAAACGFAAVLCSTAAWLEPRASRRQRTAAGIGGFLGILGIITGPTVFAPLGNHWRDSTSPRDTRKHLEQIGHALDKYHAEQGAYPVGGTTFRDKQQRERGLHSWMTALLPYVGANSIYQQIDFKKPYDDPVNRAAMSLPVESYYAAGGKRLPIRPGFAASHFAGVGGEIKDPEGATHPAGIFTQNRAIKRDEVRDGLSHTLIAGELPGAYPAWGDPGNWRTVGRGINRESRGFGNAAGNGATMLFADGSVRFFSNRTDPALLRKLSTRDAGDGD